MSGDHRDQKVDTFIYLPGGCLFQPLPEGVHVVRGPEHDAGGRRTHLFALAVAIGRSLAGVTGLLTPVPLNNSGSSPGIPRRGR